MNNKGFWKTLARDLLLMIEIQGGMVLGYQVVIKHPVECPYVGFIIIALYSIIIPFFLNHILEEGENKDDK